MTNETIDKFLGLNQRDRISTGELAYTENCSAGRYPLLAPRHKRGVIGNIPVNGCCVNDALYFSFTGLASHHLLCKFDTVTTRNASYNDDEECYEMAYLCIRITGAKITNGTVTRDVPLDDISIKEYCMSGEDEDEPGTRFTITYGVPDDATLMVTGDYISSLAELTSSYTEHSLIPMGANICIFPDKKVFNTVTSDIENMERTFTTSSATIQICDQDGEAVDAVRSATEPASPTDGTYWIDSSGTSDVLKRYSSTYAKFISISTTFIAIKATNIHAYFNQWDGVDVTESTTAEIGTQVVIYAEGTGYVIVPGECNQQITNATITLKRSVPDMDYICECNNRLWGCKYGSGINEIYASALGDPKVWNRFLGISTDSYVASRGCPGKWTGCINYLDSPIFFKEDYIEQVSVSSTGAHQISTLNINGTGCASYKSLKIVDNVLYYMGVSGFYAYTGSVPQKISYNLTGVYTEAVAGDLSGFYYVSALEDGTAVLLHYDTENQLWYREDGSNVKYFGRVGNELYAFCKNSNTDYTCFTVRGTKGAAESLEWSATTGDMGCGSNDDKYPTEISIRASGDVDETIKIYIEYDGSVTESLLGTIYCAGGHRYFTYPMIPQKCDHFRLIFRGTGSSAVWGVIVKYANGGKTK